MRFYSVRDEKPSEGFSQRSKHDQMNSLKRVIVHGRQSVRQDEQAGRHEVLQVYSQCGVHTVCTHMFLSD